MIIPMEDSMSRAQFGGSEEAMAEICQYRRALRDLKMKMEHKNPKEAEAEPEQADGEKKWPPRRGGGRPKKQ